MPRKTAYCSPAPCCAKCSPKAASCPITSAVTKSVAILREYYEGLTEKVEIKTHKAATGNYSN
jgi:hypothetical protein